ncbi:hypothetical protein Taro_034926 [Colocasia esculenta]|uniref:Ribophorin II n=1 Tax=Colocasia esculenta TaxID=4460 RepID=A0A843WDC7_COLES|nr:hypothetical protein [Colocasia esculenta]
MAGGVRFLGLVCLISLCLAAYGGAAFVAPMDLDAHRSAALETFVPKDGSFGSLEETYEALKTFQILGLKEGAELSQATCPLVSQSLASSSSKLKDLFNALRVNSLLDCKLDANILKDVTSRLQAVKDATSLLDLYYAVQSMLLIKHLIEFPCLVNYKRKKLFIHLTWFVIQEKGFAVALSDADGFFHSIKSFSQSDGRWRYSTNGGEASTFAAGLALEALAGVISLSETEIDQSMIAIVKNDITKLFDSIESYDDGTLYFDEKQVDAKEYRGPLSTTSSVVRGVTAFAAAASGKLNIPKDKIVGLAKFFLSIGTPGSPKDFFYQIDSLSCLESNRQPLPVPGTVDIDYCENLHYCPLIAVPLILSLPEAVLSSTSKDPLKVKVSTVFGSSSPPLTVKLVRGLSSDAKDISALEGKELKFDSESSTHYLDMVSLNVDVGQYSLIFEIVLDESEHANTYAAGVRVQVPVLITGFIKIDGAELSVLDANGESVESKQKCWFVQVLDHRSGMSIVDQEILVLVQLVRLDLSNEKAVSLSANHLQKLRLSFQLTTPLGHTFKPHQVFLKLRHESKVEHIFLVGNTGKQFKIVLDFLGLVEKFYYLSGRYDIQLTVGDVAMENSFLRAIGHLDLDLPEASEKSTRPPSQPVDSSLRFGPKPEISHIFRAPEKRPPKELSVTFSVLTLLPLLVFVVGYDFSCLDGAQPMDPPVSWSFAMVCFEWLSVLITCFTSLMQLIRLGVNLKNFPSSAAPAAFAVLFHAGIAAVLSLYLLFWLKLDLFTTLKALSFLGAFLVFVGHRTLSYLASASAKLKSS